MQDADNSLAELAALAETAGALVLDGVIQRRDKPDAATYIGSGKAAELRDIVLETGADTVICDGELEPRPADPPRGRRQGQGHRPVRP
ncbi:GTPase HflX [Streptomyces violarus]